LNKFLSPFFFLNNGHGTKISATTGYNSVLDISITNHRNIKFEWNVGDDPMGSDHLPIVIHLFDKLIISSGVPLSNDIRSRKRPKLCLKNFDKELFSVIIQEKIKSLPPTQGSKDPLQNWCDFILDCSLMAGTIIYDGSGNKKEFSKGKLTTFSLYKSQKGKKKKSTTALGGTKTVPY